MLPRLIGWGRAVELSMLAERLPADKAFEWGLINRLYDDQDSLMEGATELAHRLANGPRSLAMIRKAYWATWQNVYEQQLDLEARLQAEAGATEDSREGVMAFLEKSGPPSSRDADPVLVRSLLAAALTFSTPALAAQETIEWRHYAADRASTKYSPAAQVDASNVAALEVAWRWVTPTAGSRRGPWPATSRARR